MTTDAERYVIDASVGIKLFVDEPLSDEAHELFARLAENAATRFYVPDLFYTECANILWKYVNRHGMPEAEARRDLRRLDDLALDCVPTAHILHPALRLALRHGITVYDATYVATARLVRAPLVTADERLIRAIGDKERLLLPLSTALEGKAGDQGEAEEASTN